LAAHGAQAFHDSTLGAQLIKQAIVLFEDCALLQFLVDGGGFEPSDLCTNELLMSCWTRARFALPRRSWRRDQSLCATTATI